ncbi:unnamed protein product [Prunus armeniaca]|uniref:Uncharacterized protein n=1 Tax=Prunus armeniaca TaxID=36596 RepID=A0A6J5UHS9_PRUAR|nr:hypothetical protein GBA52_011708 [Prunus armeniaca]CAB4275472.1 unnamed protein product [Prunus armeniaca]
MRCQVSESQASSLAVESLTREEMASYIGCCCNYYWNAMQCSAGGEIIIMKGEERKGEERKGEGNPWMDGWMDGWTMVWSICYDSMECGKWAFDVSDDDLI